MKWLSTIKQADAGKLVLERMELDETGFPQPTGELEELEADSHRPRARAGDRPLAARRRARSGGRGRGREGRADLMTGYPGLFAGGDMVPAERTVTVGVGHGKKAARHIDAWLRSDQRAPIDKHALADFERLNTWYYADAPRTVQPVLELARRRSTFEEVVGGLDESTALFEARRCLSCGNCFRCDNCFGVCPDNAVIKLDEPAADGRMYAFDYDFCKGCGICVAECPSGAIEMIPETI